MTMDDREIKSRTQKKHEDRALQKIGEQLMELPSKQLKRMDLDKMLVEAITLAHTMKSHEARRRQIQYIGALMRDMDLERIHQALQNIQLGDYLEARRMKELQRWCDAIKAGNTGMVEEILSQCPHAERQRLSQLARNARKNANTEKDEKFSRALMRYLTEVWDAEKK